MGSMLIGSFLGLFLGYIFLMGDFKAKGKQANYQCRVCKARCPAKECMRNFLKDSGVKNEVHRN